MCLVPNTHVFLFNVFRGALSILLNAVQFVLSWRPVSLSHCRNCCAWPFGASFLGQVRVWWRFRRSPHMRVGLRVRSFGAGPSRGFTGRLHLGVRGVFGQVLRTSRLIRIRRPGFLLSARVCPVASRVALQVAFLGHLGAVLRTLLFVAFSLVGVSSFGLAHNKALHTDPGTRLFIWVLHVVW